MRRDVPIAGKVLLALIHRPEAVTAQAYGDTLQEHYRVVSYDAGIDLGAEDGYVRHLAGRIDAEQARRGTPLRELVNFVAFARRPYDAAFLVGAEDVTAQDIAALLGLGQDAVFVASDAWRCEIAAMTGLANEHEIAAIQVALQDAGDEGVFLLARVIGEDDVDVRIDGRMERLADIMREIGAGTELALGLSRLAAEEANVRAVDWTAERIGSSEDAFGHIDTSAALVTDETMTVQ